MLAIIGAVLGIILGIILPYDIPVNLVKYSAIAILAALDAIFGGLRAQLERKFSLYQFITSFFTNAALAALLAYLGDILGVDIYIGAVVAFSIRLFQNLSMIRGAIFERFRWRNVDNSHSKDV